MAYSTASTAREGYVAAVHYPRAAISWAAVFAGTVIASALSITLLTGGMGLGFIAMSPHEGEGASATGIGVGAIVWMFIVQILAYGVAGYVTGRLRPMWAPAYSDEVYFRDTAHGLAVWALSALVSLALFGSALSAVVGTAARGGAALAQGAAATVAAGSAAAAAGMGNGSGAGEVPGLPSADYVVDQLFRGEQPNPAADPQAARAELARLVAVSAARGDMQPEDRDYVARVVAAQSGVPETEARQRVDEVLTNAEQMRQQAVDTARDAADTARKAAAGLALWAFAALLAGAFVASLMAVVGGRAARDPD